VVRSVWTRVVDAVGRTLFVVHSAFWLSDAFTLPYCLRCDALCPVFPSALHFFCAVPHIYHDPPRCLPPPCLPWTLATLPPPPTTPSFCWPSTLSSGLPTTVHLFRHPHHHPTYPPSHTIHPTPYLHFLYQHASFCPTPSHTTTSFLDLSPHSYIWVTLPYCPRLGGRWATWVRHGLLPLPGLD